LIFGIQCRIIFLPIYNKGVAMQAKITLYSKKERLEKIKAYAKEKGTSVSSLVDTFFESLLASAQKESDSPITDELYGILKERPIDEEAYKTHLAKKYL